MTAASARVRLLISGRVQGVWFRGAMREQALARRVGGWVRNLRDGRVEAVVEGAGNDVEAMVAWCAHGPTGARVENVERIDEPATEAPTREFEILR